MCSNFDTLLRNVNKLNKLLDNAKRKRYAKTEFKGLRDHSDGDDS